MKRILFNILFGVLGLLTFIGCSDDDKYPTPTPLDQNTVSYEARPGAIVLKWNIPENANYKYIKVNYTLPESGKECLRLASVYSNEMLIDNLLKRYGSIDFTLQPCTPDGKGGEICTISAQADAAETTVKLEPTDKKFNITGSGDAWTDNQETTQGPIADLFDGDLSTFFHMSWSATSPFPHYIVVDLKEEVSSFRFTYTTRDHNNNDHPKEMDILVSNEFDGNNYDTSSTTKITTLASGLPTAKKTVYESPSLTNNKKFRYVWFKITASVSGNPYIALAELALYRVNKSIYNPETGETTEE